MLHDRLLSATCTILLPFLAPPHGDEKVAAGQPVPDFEFRTVLGGDGRVKLSDFRGQPVLVVWYSTVFAGMDGAHIADDLDQQHRADGLVVFLMEIKNHDATYLRALQMAELPGAECRLIVNQDLPVVYDDETGFPPKMVLVGVDGELLYAGSYQRPTDVKRLLAGELDKREKGWGEDPLARKARALAYGQGKLGEARALLEPARSQGGNADVTALCDEIDRRFDTLVRSVAYLLEQGEPGRAALAADELALAQAGYSPWLVRATEAVKPLESASGLRAADLEKKLDSLLKPTLKSKPKKGLDAKLRAFAEGEAAGTKVGERAARLAQAVERTAGEL